MKGTKPLELLALTMMTLNSCYPVRRSKQWPELQKLKLKRNLQDSNEDKYSQIKYYTLTFIF